VGGNDVPERSRYGDAFEPLIDAARANAPWAWERLYTWLAPVVVGYLRTHGVRDADDIASEVWIGVFHNIQRFRGDDAQFRSWVFTIVHRRMLDERRRLARRPEADAMDEHIHLHLAGSEHAEDAALSRMAADRLLGYCDQLNDDQRDVVLLRSVADLTVDQVAEVLGRSPGAVKALQRRGFAQLRRILEQQGATL
jgi:RNA polymerase sigma factor (sigma-70 family)